MMQNTLDLGEFTPHNSEAQARMLAKWMIYNLPSSVSERAREIYVLWEGSPECPNEDEFIDFLNRME